MTVIAIDQLPFSVSSHEFVGADHGGVEACVIVFDGGPGAGPDLHRHPYAEVFVVQEGEATFTIGDEQKVVRGGSIVWAPAGVPHAFKNTGAGRLREIDIHLSASFDTEWL
jgi:mannose-6-phosphate isomerase-like protein (cupin superfamily)